MVRVAKPQSVDEEFERSDVVADKKYDVIDCLRNGPMAPLAMQIEPLDIAGRIHRVRLAHDRTLAPDAQPQRHTVSCEAMGGAVGIATDLAIARQDGDQ